MEELFKKIKNSVYNPNYYVKELINKPFSYSLKYYLAFTFFISLLGAIVFLFTVMPGVKSFLHTVIVGILEQYPEELEIVIKNGEVLTNVNEPYFIPMLDIFDSSKPKSKSDNDFKNILVIDTKNSFSIENFKNYQTMILLTKDSFAYGNNKRIDVIPLNQAPNFTLNKNILSSFLGKIRPFLKLIYPIFFIGALLVIFNGYLFNFVYLLFTAVVIWIIAKIRKIRIGYGKSYQIGIHLTTFPIIITFLFDYIIKYFIGHFTIPLLFTILFLISAIINLKSLPVDNT